MESNKWKISKKSISKIKEDIKRKKNTHTQKNNNTKWKSKQNKHIVSSA